MVSDERPREPSKQKTANGAPARAEVEPSACTDMLMRAACNFGSTHELASRLAVTHVQLRKWMRGEEVPPTAILLRAVELIEQYELKDRGDSAPQ
jgi:hypothetical protein